MMTDLDTQTDRQAGWIILNEEKGHKRRKSLLTIHLFQKHVLKVKYTSTLAPQNK